MVGTASISAGRRSIFTRAPPSFYPQRRTRRPVASIFALLGGSLKEARSDLLARGAVIEGDEIARRGAQGAMKSLYLRDPDGNLVELGFYDP